jgi:hypothetical protein
VLVLVKPVSDVGHHSANQKEESYTKQKIAGRWKTGEQQVYEDCQHQKGTFYVAEADIPQERGRRATSAALADERRWRR